MNDLEKIYQINQLIDLYGSLLTRSQYEIMKDYYENDLSLSEISELRGISRTAVSDALKKAQAKLSEAERKIGIKRTIDSFKDEDEKTKQVIDEFVKRLKNGI